MPSSSPTDIDPRFDDLVAQLRAAAQAAPESLRARVGELAEPSGAASPTRRVTRRRAALVLVPACLLAVAAAGILTGRSTQRSGSSNAVGGAAGSARTQRLAPRAAGSSLTQATQTVPAWEKAAAPPASSFDSATQHGATAAGAAGARTLAPVGGVTALPPSQTRLTRYSVDLSLRVDDEQQLAEATRKAMRWTRSLGGFVAAVQSSSAEGGDGYATLRLRVPISHVQQAIERFSGLGTVVAQQLSLQDLQAGLNVQNRQILALRRTIAELQAKLVSASAVDRPQLEQRLASARAQLAYAQRRKSSTLREGRLTTIALSLSTGKGGVAVQPHRPGRVERAARHAWSVLAVGLAGAVYLLIVLSPVLALVALGLFARRFLRRREEARLLARA